MTGGWSRELGDSFRLLARGERWLVPELGLGAVAYVAWVIGSAAVATRAGALIGFPVDLAPGATPGTGVLAALALLWIVLPAAVATYRLRWRLLNVSGNVETMYRVGHPGSLLAAPVVALLALAAVGFALGFSWPVFALAIPASIVLLVRTAAYSYRVYAFSWPLFVQVGAFLSLLVQVAALLYGLSVRLDRGSLVAHAASVADLPAAVYESPGVAQIEAAGVLAAAVAVPVAVVVAYLFFQGLAATAVRVLEPDVKRADLRTGQRYPPVLVADADAAASPAAGVSRSGSATDSTPASDDPETAPTPVERDDEEDDDFDDVSNTRVFRPPDDGEAFDGHGGGNDSPRNGSGRADSRHCPGCGERFDPDEGQFCPSCGQYVEQ